MFINNIAQEILDILTSCGYESYIVGGCTRDSILGNTPKDWDICTNATPEEVMCVFEAKRKFKIVPTGLKHGTISLIVDKEAFEVTTYRVDGDYSDGRHPDEVHFVKNLKEDLLRRDFTMNAIAYNNGFVDPFCGKKDIGNKIIRCVGNPMDRFAEDKLRILRGLRFASVFGFEIEQNTLKAMDFYASDIRSNISVERIQKEFEKMICGKYFFEVMQKEENANIFFKVFEEFMPLFGFKQHSKHHIFDVWKHTLYAVKTAQGKDMKLVAMFHDIGKPDCFTMDENNEGHFYEHAEISAQKAYDFMTEFKFPNTVRDNVSTLVKYHHFHCPTSYKSISKAIRKFGKPMFLSILEFQKCDIAAQSDFEKNEKLNWIDNATNLYKEIVKDKNFIMTVRDLDITGEDVISCGYEKGPIIGEKLRFLFNAVNKGTVENKKEELLKLI